MLPHYNNYEYQSDKIEIEDDTIVKKNKIKMNRNIGDDY
jgi:hypothetical protein